MVNAAILAAAIAAGASSRRGGDDMTATPTVRDLETRLALGPVDATVGDDELVELLDAARGSEEYRTG